MSTEKKLVRSSIMTPKVVPFVGTVSINPFYTKETPAEQSQVLYTCGYCSKDNTIKSKDVIRCRYCGHRIMYKKRTARKMQHETR
jgi:DNA-directed RNA polymerase I, II, and III subunit RPABC4